MENKDKGAVLTEKDKQKAEQNWQKMLSKLDKTESSLRTTKDNLFKANQMAVKESGLLSSRDKLASTLSKKVLDISESANKMGIKDLDMQKKNLKIIQATLKEVKDEGERKKLEDLVTMTRKNVDQTAGLSSKIGNHVGDALIASTAILGGLVAESPILALGIGFIGKSIKDNLQARQDRKTELADSTADLKQTIMESAEDEDVKPNQKEEKVGDVLKESNEDIMENNANLMDALIERITDGFVTEEEKREQAVKRQEELQFLERQADSMDSIDSKIGDHNEANSKKSAFGKFGIAAVGAGAALLGAIKGAMLIFTKGFVGFVTKTIPKFLARINPVFLIVGTLMTGIDDAFNEFMESGSISQAIAAGLGGIVDFFTMGFISKETIEGLLNPIFDSIHKAITQPFQTMKDLWSGITGFFDGLNTDIMETFDINPKEIFASAMQSAIDNIMGLFEFIGNIPEMLMEKLTSIKGFLGESISGFLSDFKNPFSEEEPDIKAAKISRLESVDTASQAPVLGTLIEEKETRTKEANSPGIVDKAIEDSVLAISAPTTNNQVVTKNIFNSVSLGAPRRIITQ